MTDHYENYLATNFGGDEWSATNAPTYQIFNGSIMPSKQVAHIRTTRLAGGAALALMLLAGSAGAFSMLQPQRASIASMPNANAGDGIEFTPGN